MRSTVVMRTLWPAFVLSLACGTHRNEPDGAPLPQAPVQPASSPTSRRSPPAELMPADTARRLSVATYNINFGNGHLPETVETIAALGTDIILLQETTEASERAIRARLSGTYPEIRFEHCCRAGGLGVLSRFQILDAEVVSPDVGFFPAWWLRVDSPQGPLLVVDLHLRPPISDGGSWVVGFFSTRQVRAREIANLWLTIPKGEPTIVMGDFNEEAGGVLKFLGGEGFQDALPQFAGSEPTWHWQVGASTLRMQLDHVAYSAAFKAVGAHVVSGGLSDHQPVVVQLVRVPQSSVPAAGPGS
ncbi:MAG: endonuclease/exonuclease/phosphatase family protein [Nannocystaceae bacterium]|nr:endonuclease/exonuclease/phosphatase family protein [Nannocystaceae bacterium]